jgi:putative oxygen-independent coproporphyrinogen III oxidase
MRSITKSSCNSMQPRDARHRPPVGPLHLYVHIPFCVHKCAYCDFNSHVRREPPWEEYRLALLAELEHWSRQPQFSQREIGTVFFGGGTPSLAPAGLIGDMLQKIDALFGLSGDAEISLEANPGTLEAGRFAAYRAAGINRLSIGVQSFNDAELRWLERIHDAKQAVQSFEAARRAGFDNVNLDLMNGLPGQALPGWLQGLHTAIDLSPEHLSCYQLTVEPHTELARRHRLAPLPLPEDEEALAFLRQTRHHLSEAGYPAYEVSNFSRPGRHCRHNDAYWLYEDYIGIGAGAAGKWDTTDGGITRYSNVRSPETYLRKALGGTDAINSQEILPREKAAAEAVWLGLRRTAGVERACFTNRFGVDVDTLFGAALRPWRKSGHLHDTATGLQLSDLGLSMADSIAASVLAA